MKRYFEDGATVLFQGDSVTDCSRDRDPLCKTLENMGGGYPRKFKEIYDVLFPDNNVNFVNRGVSGDRVRNLLLRYDEDFKAVNPDFISVMIGINDVWRGYDSNDPTSAERYKDEFETLLKKLKSDFPAAKILIIEPFALTTHPARLGWNEDLDPKREAVKELAKKYADLFIPMYDVMTAAAKTFGADAVSLDGVHPAPVGHSVIAAEIIKTLGIL